MYKRQKQHQQAFWTAEEIDFSADLSDWEKLNEHEKYFITNILLDNSSSPLRKALELSPLGKSPSPFLGLEPSNKEIVFMAGLEGVQANKAEEIEELILTTLSDLVKTGVPKELVSSALHQLEIGQREISGGGMPYGLQLMLGCMNACVHYDNPISCLLYTSDAADE